MSKAKLLSAILEDGRFSQTLFQKFERFMADLHASADPTPDRQIAQNIDLMSRLSQE